MATALFVVFPKVYLHLSGALYLAGIFNFVHLVELAHGWKEEHIANGWGVRKQHDHAVNPKANSTCRRHSVLEGVHKILVRCVRLIIPLG